MLKAEKEAQLLQLNRELTAIKPIMAQAHDLIVAQNVSKYPIFVLHQHEVEIGLSLVEREDGNSVWSVNASTLEELVAKQIMALEQVDNFRDLYRSHRMELCLFVLSELGANFIFLPR
jgi:hypothetical protein